MGLGTYRLILAYLVVCSHLGINLDDPSGVNIGVQVGVAAVVCFYALSGFVMAALVERHFPTIEAAGNFYLDRALRILPQFWFYLVIALAAFAFNLIPTVGFVSSCTLGNIVANFLVFPFHFLWVNDLAGCLLVPPAWSLGVEVMFYAAVPFIFVFRLRGAAMVASIAVFVLAYLGVIDTGYHGYRAITGTMFIFLCGSYLFTRQNRTERVIPWVIFAGALIGLAGTLQFPSSNVLYTRSVLVGVAVAVPALFVLGFRRTGKWDAFAGHVSYGVFLNHFVVIWALAGFGLARGERFMLVAIFGTAASIISFLLVERPIQMIRRSLRTRKEAAAIVATPPGAQAAASA
jgi:peptidoglycan/LPS O-acetylase OafA/YrhL